MKRAELRVPKRVKKLGKHHNVRVVPLAESYRESICPNCQRLYRQCDCCYAESESGSINAEMGPTGSSAGVELNNRSITSLAERPLYTGYHEMSDATIKETGWDLSRVVERETLVTTFNFGTTSSGVLYTGSVPGSLLSVAFAQTPFLNFLYWRGDVVIKLQIAGSPMVQGILGMTFVPLVTYPELQTMNLDFSSLSINPTVYLFANTNTAAELHIPFNHVLSYIGTNFSSDPASIGDVTDNLGFIVVYVLEDFKSAGTVNGVTVSLFSHLENSEFKVPQLSSTISSNYTKMNIEKYGVLPNAESFVSSAISTLTSGIGAVIDPILGDIGETVKSVIRPRKRTNHKQLINEMTSKTLPSNFIGDAIDMVGGLLPSALGLLGLDNPTIPLEEHRVVVRGNGPMNYAVGPEFVEKLSILPSAISLVTPETFGTVTDEMDVDYLYSKYSYMGRFDFNKDDTVGKVLWSMPMSPFPTFDYLTGTTPIVPAGGLIQTAVWFPLLSYLGLPYKYWTGGLNLKMIVSGSSMHTGKLFVSFNYGVYPPATPVNLLDAASQYGIALEINQGSNEFVFSIPYVALTPYLEVCTGAPNKYNSMGTLNVVVMNELIAPDSVAPAISVAIFVAGADDFSYEQVAHINPAFPVYYNSVTTTTFDNAPNGAELPLYKSDKQSYPERMWLEPKYKDYHCLKCHQQWRLLKPPGYCTSCLVGSRFIEERLPKAESLKQSIAPTNVDATITDVRQDDNDNQIAPPQVDLVVDDHFGITKISLRNLAKKYQMIGTYHITSASPISTNYAVGAVKIPLLDIFRLPLMAATPPYTTIIPQSAPNGLLTWMQGMYKQFKGGVRIKLIFNLSEQSTNTVISPFMGAAAYWLPGRDLAQNNLYTDLSTVVPWLLPYSQTIGPQSMFVNQNTQRLAAITSSTSNVLEFEVPYASQYNSVLNYINDNVLNTRYSELGSLYVTCNLRLSSTISVTAYAAFADESRFGTLYRVPVTYAPAVYSMTGTAPAINLTPIANFGFGSYAVAGATAGDKNHIDGDYVLAESDISRQDLTVQEQEREECIEDDTKVVTTRETKGTCVYVYDYLKSFVTFGKAESWNFNPTDWDSTVGDDVDAVKEAGITFGDFADDLPAIKEKLDDLPKSDESISMPLNPQTGKGKRRKPANPIQRVVRDLQRFIGYNHHVNRESMASFLDSVKPGSWTGLSIDTAAPLLKRARIALGKDGCYHFIPPTSKHFRRRRPIPRRPIRSKNKTIPSKAGQILKS